MRYDRQKKACSDCNPLATSIWVGTIRLAGSALALAP